MQYKIFNQDLLLNLLNKIPTPCYIYDQQLLLDTLKLAQNECKKYFSDNGIIHYAMKANDNMQVLNLIKQSGLGIDCVSGGEIEKALAASHNANKIVFAGVGKRDSEINLALRHEIYAFNCESLAEITVINELAGLQNKVAKLMLRVNPDIDAKTHKHISTGKYDNKFGIMFADVLTFLPQLKELHNVQLLGLHYHIGSQIIDLNVFANLAQTVSQHYKTINAMGIALTDINVGGGLGIDYMYPEQNPIANFTDYFKIIATNLAIPAGIKIHFELGRSIVAQCGTLLTKVLFTKTTAGTNFAIVDAGMNDLIRPALYEAKHKIIAFTTGQDIVPCHIVGPVCESTDVFAKDLLLPRLKRGDILSILSSGAYGRVLASQYNSRDLIQEYII